MGEENPVEQSSPGELSSPWQKDPKDPELWLYVPSGVWYVRKRKKGKKPLFKSTDETKKGRARSRADAIIQEWLGKTPAQFQASQVLFREHAPKALADWLASGKYRPRTKVNMKAFIEELVSEIGHTPLTEITEGFIERWITDFRKTKSRTTFRDYVTYITKVMRHAKRNGFLVAVPDFENPDPKKKTGRLYLKKEMESLYAVAEKWLTEARGGRNRQIYRRRLELYCQLKGCFEGGLRLRECIQAPWSEVDLETGRWVIPPERVKMGSRTAQGKDIFMPDSLLPLMRELRQISKPDALFIFPNPRDPSRPIWSNKSAWRALKAQAGITGRARWHDLRHTGLTWALVGDDEFQEDLKRATPEEQDRMKKARLANPLLVSKYWGTNIRTIEGTYLKVEAVHTREIANVIQVGVKAG